MTCALIIFEITADPFLAAIVFNIKFAINHLIVAGWLVRSDPSRFRGIVCGLLMASAGMGRASAADTIAAFALGVAHEVFPGVIRAHTPALMVLLGLAGLLIAAALSLLSLFLAYVSGLKLWYSPQIVRVLRFDGWPPRLPNYENRLSMLARLTAVAIFVIAIAALVIAYTGLPMSERMMAGLLLLIVISGMTLFGLAGLASRAVQASAPSECWSDTVRAADDRRSQGIELGNS